MPSDLEPTNSHALFTREPTTPPIHHNASSDGNSNQECFPSSIDHPLLTIQEDQSSYSPLDDAQLLSYDTSDPREMDDETNTLYPRETVDEIAHPLPLRTLSPLFTPDVSPSPPGESMFSPLDVVRQLFAPHTAVLLRRDGLIESRNGYQGLRRSLSYHGNESSNFGGSDSPVPEQQLMHDSRSTQQSLETNGKQKVQAEGNEMDSSEEVKEDKSDNAANFECNICFDMAQEPVVTSCGHLFCWSCLYRWLHVHREHKTCPVCKGEVMESNITPIYGRGSCDASDGGKLAKSGESNINIPPRPRGNRFENLRQLSRPISRRFRIRNRFEGHEAYHAAFSRLRERRLLSQETNAEFGPRDSTTISQDGGGNPLFSDGIDFCDLLRDSTTVHQSNNTNRRLSSVLDDYVLPHAERTERLRNIGSNQTVRCEPDDWRRFQADRIELGDQPAINVGFYDGNRYEASTSSLNPTNSEQLIPSTNVVPASTSDRVSVSCTMASIQEDTGLSDRLGDSITIPQSNDTNRHLNSLLDDCLWLHAEPREHLQNIGANRTPQRGLDDWRQFQADRSELRHQPSISDGFNDGNGREASTSSLNPANPEQLIPSANVAPASDSDQVSV